MGGTGWHGWSGGQDGMGGAGDVGMGKNGRVEAVCGDREREVGVWERAGRREGTDGEGGGG